MVMTQNTMAMGKLCTTNMDYAPFSVMVLFFGIERGSSLLLYCFAGPGLGECGARPERPCRTARGSEIERLNHLDGPDFRRLYLICPLSANGFRCARLDGFNGVLRAFVTNQI